ncbi:hypothetical protein [Flavobacterium lacisediminis]|uniref:Uncharacterized protein n=1 Tax=Flavobacterium lacisediminis TaxID=2989705 RepID=A0ABT3EKN8_9FLAO|nr:hypothetical protein [Flavobacterium lacisediminis]MCW1149130.1 hypothetical protein [Flavobacterium lacisediminis]
MTPIQKTKTEKKVLRIYVDGKWNSTEFSNLFESFSLLYQLLIELDKIQTDESQYYLNVPDSQLSKSLLNINGQLYKKLNFPEAYENEKKFEGMFMSPLQYLSELEREVIEDLEIKEIKYASPGFTDFAGIGKIIEQLFNILKYYFPNKNERLQNQILQQDLVSKKISNLQILGYSKKDLRKLSDTRNNAILNLKQLELEDKIKNFEIQDLN